MALAISTEIFDPAATAIKARLEALQWAIDTSKFEPEAANIRCVMEGYRTGAITYSTEFTWSGPPKLLQSLALQRLHSRPKRHLGPVFGDLRTRLVVLRSTDQDKS